MATRYTRFERLVHYVCELCPSDKLGAIKLNKILWYADTFAYRLHGKTISGETAYIKRQYGPVPKNILKALKHLQDTEALVVEEKPSYSFGGPRREYRTLTGADISCFSAEERKIVQDVAEIICKDHTATSISDLSHNIIWEAANLGEEIPVNAVLASKFDPVTDADEKWAKTVIRNFERSSKHLRVKKKTTVRARRERLAAG